LNRFPLVLTCILAAQQAAADAPAIRRDLVYSHRPDGDLKLDFIAPQGQGPFPLVVCIHGGGWHIGSKGGHHRMMRLLADHGYAAATVQYRLAPKHKFPAQIDDVQDAIRCLRDHAAEYRIDPERVAALGDSAGGHLALLAGLLDPKDRLGETAKTSQTSAKVKAVVNYYGPSDLRSFKSTPQGNQALKAALGVDGRGMLVQWLGSDDPKTPILAKASPITYISAGDAAVLTLQGGIDSLVLPEQAQALHASLEKAGLVHKLVILPKAGHGFAGVDRDRTDRLTLEFLDQVLMGKKPSGD
jgi:acetyl esterase/lipase